MRRRAFLSVVLAIFLIAPPARAANVALSEITLDIDRDGKPDRAVLVAAEGTGFHAADKGSLMIGAGERADLYIYLGAGDEALDLTRKPSFLKAGIVDGERQNQIFPLEARNGSLLVNTAYNLFSNWAPETLTIVHRGGEFLVAGFTRSYDMKSGAQGECDINFLTGKGVASKGVDGKKRAMKGKFAPVRLRDWPEKRYPKECGL